MTDQTMISPRTLRRAILAAPVLLAACTVGPDYEKPAAPIQTEFKEAGQAWRQAEPADVADRGAWWSIYNDPVLDGLERQVEVSNQTLKESLAAYDQARALVDEASANFWPSIAISPSVTRSKSGGGSGSSSALAILDNN